MTATEHLIDSDGARLQVAVEAGDRPRAVAVVCHAHPRLRGTMDSPLLLALRDDLVQREFSVVRFNFRGVGRSTGTSGSGIEDVVDARAVVGHARAAFPGIPVALVGWSFGGGVTLRTAASDASLVACVAIAPAVTARPGLTAGLPPAAELGLHLPVLVVCGSNDDQVSTDAVRSWASRLATGTYVEIPGANHFFWARYESLCRTVGDWLEATV